MFDGRPVIGICNTWSEITPCNAHLREIAEYVKRGVWKAGGLPLEFPAMSLGETQMRPTAMLFRNLLAMEVEESIRGNPIDAVVLLGGCDKTTPGQLMGAASVDLPTMIVSRRTDAERQVSVARTSVRVPMSSEIQTRPCAPAPCRSRISLPPKAACRRSAGSCMTMGTASTFASVAEAMGLALPSNATLPAVDSAPPRAGT